MPIRLAIFNAAARLGGGLPKTTTGWGAVCGSHKIKRCALR